MTSASRGNVAGAVFMGLFGFFFFAIGSFAVLATIKQGDSGEGQSIWIGVFMGGFFALVGAAIMFAGFKSLGAGKKEKALAEQYPGQPWMLKPEWAEGRMVDSNKGTFFAILLMAIFWNAISWAATIGVFTDDQAEDPARFIVLLFPLVGLGLAWAAVYLFLRWKKFGSSAFEMAEVPGVIGGSLGGVVLTKINIIPDQGFQVTLRNIKEVTTGSGKNRSTHTTVLWESEQWIKEDALADDRTQSAIPIFFSIPYDCQPPSRSGNTTIKWELKVKAELPGVDYESSFQVPVFKTADSDPNFDATAARQAVTKETLPVVDWSGAGITVRDHISGATLVETQFGRHFGMLIIPLLMGIGMLVGTYYAWNSNMPKIFPVFLALFGVIMTLGILGSLFTSLRLKIFKDRLESERKYFGMTKHSVVEVSQLQRIESKSTMSSGETHFYDLIAHKTDGTTVKLPMSIKGKSRADAMIRLIEEKIAR